MHNITNALTTGKHFVFESGTGSGKTICALSAALPYALAHNKKILYTTRTNAQQQQVIVELRSIQNKTKDKRIFGVGMQGRGNMCLLARQDPDIANGSSEELSKFCSNQKKLATSNNSKGCSYYRQVLHDKQKIDGLIEWTKKNLPTAEEFIQVCQKKGVCPYEVNKIMIREATVVVVPYIYVFDKTIRIMLFDWLSVSDDDIILIVDEAHNLPNYIRDLFSAQLSMWMLNSCVSEAKKFGDPQLSGGKCSVSAFCTMLIEFISILRDNYVYGILENGIRTTSYVKHDALIPSHELDSEILSRLNITSKTLHDIISDLIAYGEKIQEYREKEGKLPRSYLHKLGMFLDVWNSLEMSQYAKLVVDAASGKNPRIEAYCLDPSIGAEIIKYFHSSIHMSGTLEPLEEYRDSMGLSENTELVSYPSPFPKENRKLLFVSDVTTKYDEMVKDEKIVSRMISHVKNICNTFPKNTMIFFPSFNVMSIFRKNEDISKLDRCVFFEEQSMPQAALMDLVSDFKEYGNNDSDGAALFSVMGGRISEGMDFPAEQLEIAVIVGIPYPKPTARQRGLQHYYDIKFRKGWEYTVEAPTARKLLQSIGRLIRDENDRGVAIILDRRAPRFKKYIRDLEESKNLMSDISNFINK